MKYRVRIPRNLRRRFCKKCGTYWIPGKNLRVRLSRGLVIYQCLECGATFRFPHKKRR